LRRSWVSTTRSLMGPGQPLSSQGVQHVADRAQASGLRTGTRRWGGSGRGS
jgi:hypothetical protein